MSLSEHLDPQKIVRGDIVKVPGLLAESEEAISLAIAHSPADSIDRQKLQRQLALVRFYRRVFNKVRKGSYSIYTKTKGVQEIHIEM